MNNSYLVFEDLVDATDTKIHLATCGHAADRTRGPTTRWHGPFETYEGAVNFAEKVANQKKHGFRDAGCCLG